MKRNFELLCKELNFSCCLAEVKDNLELFTPVLTCREYVEGIQATDTDSYDYVPSVYDLAMTIAGQFRAEQVGLVEVRKVEGETVVDLTNDFYTPFLITLGGPACHASIGREVAKLFPNEVYKLGEGALTIWNDSIEPFYYLALDLKLRG